jgi:hypothetical protein
MTKRIDRPQIDFLGKIISILRFPQDLPPNNGSTGPPTDLEGHFGFLWSPEDLTEHIEGHRTFPIPESKTQAACEGDRSGLSARKVKWVAVLPGFLCKAGLCASLPENYTASILTI